MCLTLSFDFDIVASSSTNSAGAPVVGVIDGKFDDGYLVTVSVGSEKLKGVLYQIPPAPSHTVPQNQSWGFHVAPAPSMTVHRRRRRKKSEIKRRDPAHPKPNRSGYNFFFKEQHARLKPLYPGKDREISRMIGELWNKLKDAERSVSNILFEEKILCCSLKCGTLSKPTKTWFYFSRCHFLICFSLYIACLVCRCSSAYAFVCHGLLFDSDRVVLGMGSV